MTAIHWKNAVDGAFGKGADWRGGAVPGPADDAVLDAAGSPYTATSNADATVSGIQLAANATLAVTGGTFTATAGTDGGVNAGMILVANGGTFGLGGSVDNSGVIALAQSASAYPGMVLLADTTLSGGGLLTLGTGRNFGNLGVAGPLTLTNVDNTISGQGDLGASAGFTLVNESSGVVSLSDQSYRLQIDAAAITNDGTLQSAVGTFGDGDGLVIEAGSISGKGGEIISETFGYVFVAADTITGQHFTTMGSSSIVLAESHVKVSGAISNAGQIYVAYGTALTLTKDLTLTGGGRLTFFKRGKVAGSKAATVLDNVDNVISGSGALGAGKLTLINEAGGTIVGAGPFVRPLTIDTGQNTIVNAGALETTQVGKLVIQSAVANTGLFAVEGGVLTVNGAVTGSGRAIIAAEGGFPATLDFAAGFSQDVAFQGDGGTLGLALSQGFAATITGFTTTASTALDLGDIGFVSASEATFSGTATAGVLTVTDGTHTAQIHLDGDYRKALFTAQSDGHGGVTVVATTAGGARPPHALISAMASLGASPAHAIHTGEAWSARAPMLSGPRVMAA